MVDLECSGQHRRVFRVVVGGIADYVRSTILHSTATERGKEMKLRLG